MMSIRMRSLIWICYIVTLLKEIDEELEVKRTSLIFWTILVKSLLKRYTVTILQISDHLSNLTADILEMNTSFLSVLN